MDKSEQASGYKEQKTSCKQITTTLCHIQPVLHGIEICEADATKPRGVFSRNQILMTVVSVFFRRSPGYRDCLSMSKVCLQMCPLL